MTETVKRGPRGVLNMTEGNPYKMIIRFALPVLLSQVFQQLYNTADTYPEYQRELGWSLLRAMT